VVGVDVAEIELPQRNENVIAFTGDLADPATSQEILARLGGSADVVLCDAAPKLTGVRATDRAREEALLEAVEARLPELLRPGGSAVCKLLDCPEADRFRTRLAARFGQSRVLRPQATRKGSSERYLLLRDFRP
jgi:23S rRNA U2552 (ribose-2'-O)-methylase RlmE/FtsJ